MSYLQPPSTLNQLSIVDSYRRDSGGSRQDKSTEQQLEEIQSFCQEHKLQLRHNFVDEARSGGSTAGRDEFNRMVDLYRHEEERPNGLLLWNYARFARDFDNAVYYKSLIRTFGIVIHSLNDRIPEGDYGRVVEFFIDMSNEEKRRQTSADSKRGLRDLVLKHGCVPGQPPRGFKREKVILGSHRDGEPHIAHRWIPDPAVVPRILRAFKMRASGSTLSQIQASTHLYSSINSYATFWPNKLYIGILEFGDLVIENYCAPTVPKPIWDAVQERQKHHRRWKAMKESSVQHPRRVNSRFLLSGLARHARCGSPLYGNSSRKPSGWVSDSYLCTRAYRRRDCVRERIPRQLFEDEVMRLLHEEILDRQQLSNVHQVLNSMQSNQLAEYNSRKKEITDRVGINRRQKNRIADAIADGGHSRTLLDRLAALEAEALQLNADLTRLEAAPVVTIPEIPLEALIATSEKLKIALANADLEKKRKILRGYISHVEVQREGDHLTGTIFFYYPPPFPKAPGPDGMPIYRNSSGPPSYTHTIPFPFALRLPPKNYSRNR